MIGQFAVSWRHRANFLRASCGSFFAVLAVAGILSGCAETIDQEHQDPTFAKVIRKVLEQDTRLGTVRNNASRTGPIALAVEDYVAGLDALDLEYCPEDFRLALRRHRDAWYESVAFLEQHAELRGELHDVFDAIRAKGEKPREGLERVEAGIWETWAGVEASKNAHLGVQYPR